MKNKIGILPLLLFILPLTISCSQKELSQVVITQVYDGDTFAYQNQKIRLFGVDTPESTIGAPTFLPTVGLEAIYAAKAKMFAQSWLADQTVTIDKQTTDKYQRVVAKISKSSDLGIDLITNGLARVAYISLEKSNPYFTSDTSYYQELLAAQYLAYINNVGLWAQKTSFKIIFPKAN